MSDPEHAPRGVAPLSVETDLSLAIGGGRADVESTGRRLFVRFHSIPDAVRAFRGRPADAGDALPALLTATDLTVEVRVRDRTVLVAGAGARAGPLSRLLGIDPAEVRIGGVVGALGAEARRLV